jgi:hypothetical protein
VAGGFAAAAADGVLSETVDVTGSKLWISVSMGIDAFGGSTGTGPVESIPGVRG